MQISKKINFLQCITHSVIQRISLLFTQIQTSSVSIKISVTHSLFYSLIYFFSFLSISAALSFTLTLLSLVSIKLSSSITEKRVESCSARNFLHTNLTGTHPSHTLPFLFPPSLFSFDSFFFFSREMMNRAISTRLSLTGFSKQCSSKKNKSLCMPYEY